MGLAQRAELGLLDAIRREHLLGDTLVHRYRAAEHARADVRDVGEFEHTLDGAVLAEWAVEEGEHDGAFFAAHLCDDRRNRCGLADGFETVGDVGWTFRQCRHRVGGEHPCTASRDADGSHSILVGIECTQHVCSSHATHVVLCGFATEQHDDVGARGRLSHCKQGNR